MGLLELLMSPANFIKMLIALAVLSIILLVGGFAAVLAVGLDKVLAFVILLVVIATLPKLSKHKKLDKNTAIILAILVVVAVAVLFVPQIRTELTSLSIASLGGG